MRGEARAYYNEIDPYAAQWLRNLIAGGHIAPGDVDERSIVDVRPSDLEGYAQCHFFAGVGVWSYALRGAGWADGRQVWTGSCPCQPFSTAGKGGGFDDERHLWPAFHWLIAQRRPSVVFGEQVASKAVDTWIDLVHADVEALGYAFGSEPFPAASVGAPHIRERNFWLADAMRGRAGDNPGKGLGAQAAPHGEDGRLSRKRLRAGVEGASGRVGVATGSGREGLRAEPEHREPVQAVEGARGVADSIGHGRRAGGDGHYGRDDRPQLDANGRDGWLAHNDRLGCGAEAGRSIHDAEHHAQSCGGVVEGQPGPTNGIWRDADWLFCRDGKWRPVEPGTFPLAHGATSRVGRLRAYGNAIVAQAAQVFIKSYLDIATLEGSAA